MKNLIFLFTSALCCFTSTTSFGQEQEINMFPKETFKYSIESKAVEEQPVVYRDITTTIAGSLAEKLGNEANTIDSLVVAGPINADDIRTLWDASFKGRLSVINLENAEIENGIVPEDAFWHHKEQLDPSGEFINTIHLRRIILPDGVKRIEEGAFAYCINLEEINIPSSLQYLGTYAFMMCVSLKTDPLIFPEGFERFGQLVFSDCSSLTGKVVLPSTIKEIDDGAFFRSKITSINLPEGLERIGLAAFYACRLEEIWIPNSCQDLSSPTLFQQNYFLKRIHLPEGLDRIPKGFADACFKLQEVNIPSSVKSIGIAAFQQCYSLKKIELPNGLETIETDAFWHCDSLEQIVFPATLKMLGQESCSYISELKRIYCMASEPPICEESTLNPGNTPFGDYEPVHNLSTPNDIPVYVPVGTAEKYRKAWGWDYFTNFIETDDFPTTGVDNITISPQKEEQIYDLSGKKVTSIENGRIYIINGKKVISTTH